MRAAVFIVPGRLEAITGGSIYDRRIVEGLRARGWSIDVLELEGAFPRASADALSDAESAIANISDGATVAVDGLAFGAMPDVVERHRDRLRFVAIVHLPLALEIGLDAVEARRLEASECRALAAAEHVVVTGRTTIDMLEGYGINRARISVVEPGTDPGSYVVSGFSRTTSPLRMVNLLSVGNLVPGKGHDDLIRALAGLRDLDWTLTIVGDTERHPPTTLRIQHLIDCEDLQGRVSLAGPAVGADLTAAYERADVFVLATRRETYGMAVAEALAHGLPVISTATGEIPRLVGGEGGRLSAPGDIGELRESLRQVLLDAQLRRKMRDGARHARERLPSWDESAGRMASVLEAVRNDPPST